MALAFVQRDASLGVLSFNIRYDNPGDGDNGWKHRADTVAAIIGQRYRVDLAGLQEVLVSQLRDLEERLPDFAWIGVGRSDGAEGGEFSPVFYRREALELLDQGTFWLSETPEVPGSRSWDAALPRIVTWGRFQERDTGRTFFHFNTHFDHKGVEARAQSAMLLVGRIRHIAGQDPVVLTGDLNDYPGSDVLTLVREDGLQDAILITEKPHSGPTGTTNDWNRVIRPPRRIDYVLTSRGIDVLEHRILSDRTEGRFPSDHLPVMAQIRFAK